MKKNIKIMRKDIKNFVFITTCLLFLLAFCQTTYSLELNSKLTKNDFIFNQIKESLYIKNFPDSPINVIDLEPDFYQFNPAGNVLISIYPYTQEEPKEIKATLRKNKIFYLYSVNNLKDDVDIYKKIINNESLLKNEVLKAYVKVNDTSYDQLGTYLKAWDNQYYKAILNRISGRDYIRLYTIHGGSSDLSIEEIFKNKDIRNQLKNSNLNLDETKAIMLEDFSYLHYDFGILFYDSVSEYYLCLTPYEYTQTFLISDFILESERRTKKMEKYQLYDVHNDLMPFLLQEEETLNKAYERADKAIGWGYGMLPKVLRN